MSAPVSTKYWHQLDDGRVQCDLCPHECKLKEGQRGLCYVRGREEGQIKLYTWGRSSGFCIDPIEKKPLNHYYPGQPILSYGTAGCNLTCKFCQNWDMSKSREMDTLQAAATPEQLALSAKRYNCVGIACTYNDPVIYLEYATDVAQAAHSLGLKNVAVSAGYINPLPRPDFFRYIDAANIDLKAFNQSFYQKLCGGQLSVVLDTLLYLKLETDIWFEITTLLIPGENDSPDEIEKMCRWIMDNLGPDVPLHFSAFHPDFKMLDKPRTPEGSLLTAREIAMKIGLHYVFTGNIHHPASQATYCPSCGECLIGRDWYELGTWGINIEGCCNSCGYKPAGIFTDKPGDWGSRRLPVKIA